MAISTQIKQDIPKLLKQFKKLISGRPYFFHSWKPDSTGIECLYYVFTGSNGRLQKKKIPLPEILAAVKRFQQSAGFNRSDYKKLCPFALSSGPCGFAVIGRYLEFRYNAKYKGRNQGFALWQGRKL